MIISHKILESNTRISPETKSFLNDLGIDVDEFGTVKIVVSEFNKDLSKDYSLEFEAKLNLTVKDDTISGTMKSYFSDKSLVFAMVRAPVEKFLSSEFYPFISNSVKELKSYLAYSTYSLYDFFNMLSAGNPESKQLNSNYMLTIAILRGFLYIGDLLSKILNKLSTK